MDREKAEEIVEYMQTQMSNLYSECYDASDISIELQDAWAKHVQKIAKRGRRINHD